MPRSKDIASFLSFNVAIFLPSNVKTLMGECFIEGKRKIAMRELNKKGKSYVESIIKGTLALWDYNDKGIYSVLL